MYSQVGSENVFHHYRECTCTKKHHIHVATYMYTYMCIPFGSIKIYSLIREYLKIYNFNLQNTKSTENCHG